ncbi:MAG: hypothetical protein ABSB15_14965 [Bryobacteraceae bacterium]|jgi:hypothetical protein
MPAKKGKITNLLKVPSPETDDKLVTLADWVEVKALLESDGNASQEDLSRALQRAYSMGESAARALSGDVFRELQDREKSCVPLRGKGRAWEYPFKLNNSTNLLSFRGKLSAQSKAGMLYTFLLVASRADMDSQRKLDNLDPTAIFEQLCADILLNFWGGKSELSGSLVFGTARKKAQHNHQFHSNIEHLCVNIRDGRGMRADATTPGAGDGKLDVVVWRVFADGRSGGLVGFGQCKTGIHWRTHLTKLQPRGFCTKYFAKPLLIDPVRVYMVPHRVNLAEWDDSTTDGGLLLDRCRLVQYGYDISNGVFGNCRAWLNAAIDRQRRGLFTI